MITDVGIDMDGVMYDFATEFRNYCGKRMNRTDLPFPRHWEFYEDWGLDRETFYNWLDEATLNDNIFLTGEPLTDTVEGWQRLRGMGMRIHILTHRRFPAYEQTVRWLNKHGFLPDSLHFGEDKVALSAIAVEDSASIDDHIGYYEMYQQVEVLSFLRTQPWNLNYYARRATTLLDFACKVEQYNNYLRMENQAWAKR